MLPSSKRIQRELAFRENVPRVLWRNKKSNPFRSAIELHHLTTDQSAYPVRMEKKSRKTSQRTKVHWATPKIKFNSPVVRKQIINHHKKYNFISKACRKNYVQKFRLDHHKIRKNYPRNDHRYTLIHNRTLFLYWSCSFDQPCGT